MRAPHAVALAALACLLALLPALPVPNADPLLQAPQRPPNERVPIVILHMYDTVSFFQRLGAVTGNNKRRYAARHGYQMVESTPLRTTGILKEAPCEASRLPGPDGKCWVDDTAFDIDHSRAPTFGKVKLTLAACRGRDNGWILWMDADAMVVNQTIRLESLIDDGYDIMLAYDWLMLNAGMLLMKCSPWMKGFLHNVYDARKFDTARALDQSSFQEHLDNLTATERDAHLKIVPKYAMNVYTEEYRPGDFLLHMAGKLYEATEPGLVAIAHQFDILSTVDDREDIEAFFRSTRLLNYYSGVCKVIPGQRQSECKSVDSRRLLLNESLGSMSTPNRYRHVGLRYYWLGDWKDKYDVPGWDIKRKALPIPQHAPPGHEMPPMPVANKHEHLRNTVGDAAAGGGVKLGFGKASGSDTFGHAGLKHDPPEVDHDIELKPENPKENIDIDVDDGGDDEEGWPVWLRAIMWGLGVAITAVGFVLFRKRRQKVSKMQ